MRPERIDELAHSIFRRRPEGEERFVRGPYILFLGEGCATAAGVPNREELARIALKSFGETSSGEPKEAILNRFYAHLDRLTPEQTARMLHRLYANLPVPAFYRDLATAIRQQLFPLIMTTNIDTLLEQALRDAGMRAADFQITSLSSTTPMDAFSDAEDVVNIIKLHGDLGRGDAAIVPGAIDSAIQMSRRFVKAELRGDLIMVGHRLGDDPIDRWLAHSPDRELWWVNEEDPLPLQRVMLESWTTNLQTITGELARPPIFFGELADSLLRLSREGHVSTPPPGLEDLEFSLEAVQAPAAAVPSEDRRLFDLLSGEIRRSQSMLQSLELEISPGERSPKVQEQIKYEKNHITQLEDKIRSLPEVKPRVLTLIDNIYKSLKQAAADGRIEEVADPDLQSYLDLHINTARSELQKPSPNAFLVSASLGATLTLADRFLTKYGSDVLSADDVRELATYAPTAAGKVFL